MGFADKLDASFNKMMLWLNAILSKSISAHNQTPPPLPTQEHIYSECSIKAKEFHIKRGDSPDTKKEKTAKRETVWQEYNDKAEQFKEAQQLEKLREYGRDFFSEIEHDEDVIGWRWVIGTADKGCAICHRLAGKYKKGTGPKFPAHIGCTCHLSPIYEGEAL